MRTFVSSDIDADEFIVESWQGNCKAFEIRKIDGELRISIHNHPLSKSWEFTLDEFKKAFETAIAESKTI